MGIQAFHFGKFPNGLRGLLEGRLRVFDDTGPALKLVDRQATKGSGRTTRWQSMTGAGHIIPDHGGRLSTDEDGSSGGDFAGNPSGVFRHDFAVFRSQPIHQGNRFVHSFDLYQPTVAIESCLHLLTS